MDFCHFVAGKRNGNARNARQLDVINGATLKSTEMSLDPSLVPGKKIYGINGDISEP
jgi:hypothetical protein